MVTSLLLSLKMGMSVLQVTKFMNGVNRVLHLKTRQPLAVVLVPIRFLFFRLCKHASIQLQQTGLEVSACKLKSFIGLCMVDIE